MELNWETMFLWSTDFDKSATTIKWEKNSLFNKWGWDYWISPYKIMRLSLYLTPYTKTNLKCIKDLNLKLETIKIHWRKHRHKSLWPQIWQRILTYGMKSMNNKRKKNGNSNLIKIKPCPSKETTKKVKWQFHRIGKNICKSYLLYGTFQNI